MVSGEDFSFATLDPIIHPSLPSPCLALQERRLALAFLTEQVMQPHVGFRLAAHLGVGFRPGFRAKAGFDGSG